MRGEIQTKETMTNIIIQNILIVVYKKRVKMRKLLKNRVYSRLIYSITSVIIETFGAIRCKTEE